MSPTSSGLGSMRAVVARDGELRVDTVDIPRPQAGEILVRTLVCGICGSDIHALRHGTQLQDVMLRAGGAFQADPASDIVPGHEFCAEVVDYGPDTEHRFPIGSRVVSQPVLFRGDLVEPLGFSNTTPGGYGQYMAITDLITLAVPDHLPTPHAALTEPLAVGVHAVGRATLTGNEAAVVIGAGPVGLTVISALKLAGIGPIIVSDFSPARRALALALGADEVVDPAIRSPYASFADLATVPVVDGGLPPDWAFGRTHRPQVVFECVGVPGVLQSVIEGADPGAQVVVVGVCMETDSIEPLFAITRELDLRFAFGHQPHEFAAALQHLADGSVDTDLLITGTTGLHGVNDSFELLERADEHCKILVDPNDDGGLVTSDAS